eukprot:2028010-Rhodomonas_salina.1
MSVGVGVFVCISCTCYCLRNLGQYEEEYEDEETGGELCYQPTRVAPRSTLLIPAPNPTRAHGRSAEVCG